MTPTPGRFDARAAEYEALLARPDLLHMGYNCNLLPTHPAIEEAMIAAIRDGQYRHYGPAYGLARLRELFLEDLGLPGAEAVVTGGATEALFVALRSVVRPGDEAITTDPTWPHARDFLREQGARLTEVPVYDPAAGYRLTPGLLERHLTPGTRVLSIVDPLNPLGSGYTEAEIKALCALAEARGAYLVHDATYRDFADQHFPATRYYERAIVTTSLSKACGFSGLRIGVIAAAPRLMAEIARAHVSRLGASVVAQRGAIAALETKTEWFPGLFRLQRENQARVVAGVTGLAGCRPLVTPSQGNFVAVDVTGTGVPAPELARRLLERNLSIRSGEYTSARFGTRFVRITTTVPASYIDALCAAWGQALPSRESSPA